jgi:DNA-binding LytR/AlgR family response regulator
MKNCYDAIEALEYLNENEVDLIFLDLNMPKLKGFDFLRTLSFKPKVIVTTAYKEYAIEGYELNIADYLLKPFSFERFLKAINKALSLPTKIRKATSVESYQETKSIFLRSNKKYIQVALDNIQYLESTGNYAKVVTLDETIVIREKISDMMHSFSDDDFLRVHKSYAVAIKHINSIEGNRILIGEHVIPFGKMYTMKIMDLGKGL